MAANGGEERQSDEVGGSEHRSVGAAAAAACGRTTGKGYWHTQRGKWMDALGLDGGFFDHWIFEDCDRLAAALREAVRQPGLSLSP